MANFVYVISDPETKDAVLVDPAWETSTIVRELEQRGLNLKGVLVTHYHPDHVGGHLWGHDIDGVAEILKFKDVPIYAHKAECEGISLVTGIAQSQIKACEGGDTLALGKHKITFLHTPGHTPGSQCFLTEGNLVSGDTLFLSGCGRVDLPGGDSDQLYFSLTQKIAKLPHDTMIYPGHRYDRDDHASLSQVMRINPYLQVASLEQWRANFG